MGFVTIMSSEKARSAIQNYTNEILMVGISYAKDDPDKKHTCQIECWQAEEAD